MSHDPCRPSYILYPLQHGFRRNRSCETKLIELIDNITLNMSTKKQTDVLIMDFSKAFDKDSHSLLIHKLKHYGIHGKVNTWVQNFLANRLQAVIVDGEMSAYVSVESSVPQGYDMAVGINSTVRLFADNTIAYLASTSEVDQLKLQEDLNKLEIGEKK